MPSGFILSTELWVEREPGSAHTSDDAVVSSPVGRAPEGTWLLSSTVEEGVSRHQQTPVMAGMLEAGKRSEERGGWRPSLQVGICLCVKTVPRQGLA